MATSPDYGVCLCPLGFVGDQCETGKNQTSNFDFLTKNYFILSDAIAPKWKHEIKNSIKIKSHSCWFDNTAILIY